MGILDNIKARMKEKAEVHREMKEIERVAYQTEKADQARIIGAEKARAEAKAKIQQIKQAAKKKTTPLSVSFGSFSMGVRPPMKEKKKPKMRLQIGI